MTIPTSYPDVPWFDEEFHAAQSQTTVTVSVTLTLGEVINLNNVLKRVEIGEPESLRQLEFFVALPTFNTLTFAIENAADRAVRAWEAG